MGVLSWAWWFCWCCWCGAMPRRSVRRGARIGCTPLRLTSGRAPPQIRPTSTRGASSGGRGGGWPLSGRCGTQLRRPPGLQAFSWGQRMHFATAGHSAFCFRVTIENDVPYDHATSLSLKWPTGRMHPWGFNKSRQSPITPGARHHHRQFSNPGKKSLWVFLSGNQLSVD